MMKTKVLSAVLFILAITACQEKKETAESVAVPVLPIQLSTSSANGVSLLALRTIDFAKGKNDQLPTIEVDTAQKYQTVEGFGFTLTGGSAQLLHKMGTTERKEVLEDFFGNKPNSISVSYLRVSMGASDLDEEVFSYNDIPAGQTDKDLQFFSLSKDTLYLIPILKEILAINPAISIMASPWSPPLWMKTNGNSIGGGLKPAFYSAYAQYFVKYIKAMQSLGIPIRAITIQNEPQHGGNNPSMVMSAAEQAEFIKNHLGPAFQTANISTKIVVWDHNCDNPNYPISILDDAAAKAFVSGSAFHLYAGDISALSQVHDKHPDKDLYFTEQWTGAQGQFGGDLQWHIKNVVIGSMRNWSKTALEWNLANDPSFGPHTPGGCTECRGAITISGSQATKNVSYYIIGQASKFVPAGSVRLGSNIPSQLSNVAFQTPSGKMALIVLNESDKAASFNISCASKWIAANLPANTVGTFFW